MWCEFENYEFNITGESPKRQWVNGLRQRQDARHFQDVFMKLNAFVIDETVNLSFKRHRSLFLRLHLTPIIHYMTVIILINDAIMASLDRNGPLTRYVKLRVTHAPGMLETFSPPPRTQKETTSWLSRYASRHVREKPMDFLSDSGHARVVIHAGIANPRLWGKRSRLSRMRNPQFYLSSLKPMSKRTELCCVLLCLSHMRRILSTNLQDTFTHFFRITYIGTIIQLTRCQ